MPSVCDIRLGSLAKLLPWPDANANKYTRGKLTLIGGSSAYPGAICMAARSANKMGAGYVEVFCASEALLAMHTATPSIVAGVWDGFDIAGSSLAHPKAGNPQACLVGPGMDGKSGTESRLFFFVLSDCAFPLVADGGALSYLATPQGKAAAQKRQSEWSAGGSGVSNADAALVLTPHFGEAERLAAAAGIDVGDKDAAHEESCLIRLAISLSESYGATVVLKGPVTFISVYGDGGVQIVYAMRFGTPALAKAGSGDVLSGMIASLLAQGMSVEDACVLADSLHAVSGRIAADRLTEICVCAEDIICNLPESIRRLANPKELQIFS